VPNNSSTPQQLEAASNVVRFPKEKLSTAANVQSQEEYLKMIEEYKTRFADELAEILSNQIFGELARCGVDFSSKIDDVFPSMVMVVESIRALHLKCSGIHHPLQDLAVEAYDNDGDEEEDDEEVEGGAEESSDADDSGDGDDATLATDDQCQQER
jgi:hypothetical protein